MQSEGFAAALKHALGDPDEIELVSGGLLGLTHLLGLFGVNVKN